MTGSGYLERRYRRLLVLYPRRYRRRHEEEILAVLLEGASPGQRRPRLAEAASLAWSGLGMRLRPGVPRPARTVRTAVRLMYLGALLELGVLAVVAATAGRLHSAILAHDHGYTAAQWHAEFHQHIVPLEVGAPIAACVWVWLAWANGRGHGWARVLFLVFAGVTTASLPLIAITMLVALGTIHASGRFVLAAVVVLLAIDVAGWRLVSAMFDRERLITGTRP